MEEPPRSGGAHAHDMLTITDRSHANELHDLAPFRECSHRQLRHIRSLTTELDIRPGHVLCREGERGRQAFVVVEGWAEATAGTDEANGHVATLGRGAVIGELAVVGDRPRTATVTAVTPMRVLVFTSGELREVLTDVPSVRRRVEDVVAARTEA